MYHSNYIFYCQDSIHFLNLLQDLSSANKNTNSCFGSRKYNSNDTLTINFMTTLSAAVIIDVFGYREIMVEQSVNVSFELYLLLPKLTPFFRLVTGSIECE